MPSYSPLSLPFLFLSHPFRPHTRGSPPRGRPYPCPVLVRQGILFIFSVEIYMRMSTDLLPTPAKSHYIFNLRDLSKCVQGKGCL